MGQLVAFKSDIKFSFPKLSKIRRNKQTLVNCRYDYNYMFQKYGINAHSFLEWMIKKMKPTGSETVVDYGYFKHLLYDEEKLYFNSFKKVYVISTANNVLDANLTIENCFSDVKFLLSHRLKLDISSNSIDYFYVNYRPGSHSEVQQNILMLEFLRTLKADGSFYVTVVSKEYYLAIYELFEGYELEMMDLSFCNEMAIFERMNTTFEKVNMETYRSNLWITNIDDLISYILMNPELKLFSSIISSQGISKLRHTLKERLNRDGGILIPYYVNVIEGNSKIQLKLI